MSQRKLSRAPPVKPHEAQQFKQGFEITVLPQRQECAQCSRMQARIVELERSILQRDDNIRCLQEELSFVRQKLEKLDSKPKIPAILGYIPSMPKAQFPAEPASNTLQYSETFGSDLISLKSQSISTFQKTLCFTFQMQQMLPSDELTDKLETLQNSFSELYNDPLFIYIQNQVMDAKPVFFTAINKQITQFAARFEDLHLQQVDSNQQFFALSADKTKALDLSGLGLQSIYVDGDFESVNLDGNYGQIVVYGCTRAQISILCKNSCVVSSECVIEWV